MIFLLERWSASLLSKHAKKWFEFRSKVIHDFVKKAKRRDQMHKPAVQLE